MRTVNKAVKKTEESGQDMIQTIEQGLQDLRDGKCVLVIDDPERRSR